MSHTSAQGVNELIKINGFTKYVYIAIDIVAHVSYNVYGIAHWTTKDMHTKASTTTHTACLKLVSRTYLALAGSISKKNHVRALIYSGV